MLGRNVVVGGCLISDVGEVVAYDISVADDSKEVVGHRCSKQEQGSAHMLCCLLIGTVPCMHAVIDHRSGTPLIKWRLHVQSAAAVARLNVEC